MQADWTPVREELRLWRREGLVLPLWWRDDDAVTTTPALDRLAGLAERLDVPLHLAVIPRDADEMLVDFCTARRFITPMVHGWGHVNHAGFARKKAEFGQARAGLVEDAAQGRARMREMFGGHMVDIFVPPWNRIAPELVAQMAELGYRGISTYTPRPARLAAPGLVQINTHIDPIHWRKGGALVPEERLIADLATLLRDRRAGRTDAAEPLGLLTHHLVHDPAIWAFTERCLNEMIEGGATPVNLAEMQDALP